MLRTVLVLSFLGLTNSVTGQLLISGSCPTVTAMQSFDVQRFAKRWFLLETTGSGNQVGQCADATYTMGPGGVVTVRNTEVRTSGTNEPTLHVVTGTATQVGDGSGRLVVSINNRPVPSANYYILATDYDNFALVYSCSAVQGASPISSRYFMWILSTDRSLSVASNNAINTAFNALPQSVRPTNRDIFNRISHTASDCFYLPEPGPANVPVRMRGTCERPQLPPNFNAQAFATGQWNVIETYPSAFQNGGCINARYTIQTDGTITVLNTQVVNQALDTMTGTAVQPTAGVAELTVSFPIAGTSEVTSMPYYILSVVPDSYALIYSCRQVDSEYREVWSWKLSRTRNLAPSVVASLNTVIADYPELNSRFYIPVQQTNDACFYFPPYQVGVPVNFPGICYDTPVPVVANFNMNRFSGVWHEIEAYYETGRRGQCINHDYAVAPNNVLDRLSTYVFNQELFAQNGTMIFGANAQGGGNMTLTVEGEARPIWIVATDYDDHALAYSCRDGTDGRRTVYAWKLSRNRTLSSAGQTAINNAMTNINVLNNAYFDPIGQSDAACFHYPEFEEGLPGAIELPGQCPTVRGIPNFNTTLFQGRWLEIERYPQPDREGDCGQYNYATRADGDVLDVLNTQVLGQTLHTQNGFAFVSPADGSGVLGVVYNNSGVKSAANYYILATDYDDFALVYRCVNLENGNRQVYSWKLGRNPTLLPASRTQINSVIELTQGLRPEYYISVNQTQDSCFYVPELVPGEEVRFRGSCVGISGQANFNMQQFQGRWHEIRSYTTTTDRGLCRSTMYEPGTGNQQFVESSVFGDTARETRGTLVANPNGRLTKTRVGGTAEDIWVLATDHTSYSVMLSCAAIPGTDTVRVWSSINSRTRVLPAQAQTMINQVVANNPFLSHSLYQDVNQTESGCFHIPSLAPTDTEVVLSGQCDTAIPVQDNFNLTQFIGTWYQIERYPYPEVSRTAECIGTRYTIPRGSTNNIDVLNWEVMDSNRLTTISGSAEVRANVSQLVVSIPAGNTNTSALHVLKTDYKTFALLYTCENINQYERVVVAFKLSRTRTLPSSAAAAMNWYMMDRQELDQGLFISVPQRDDCIEPSSSALLRSSIIVLLISYFVHLLT